MKGIQKIKISNKYASFSLELRRNITVVRGDSGTGKTTLFNLISEHTRLGAASGVNLSSNKRCMALTDLDWKNQLRNTKDSIVFIDEGDQYVYSREFAEEMKASDNYYVLFVRENLHELPYSVEEIYEIKTSGKYHTLKKMYKPKKGFVYAGTAKGKKDFRMLLAEDAKSGFQFYENYFAGSGVQCFSADGNSGIYNWLLNHLMEQKIFVVADGAAFGAEMNRVMELQKRFPDRITICLPESFEWMILKSGLIATDNLEDMLANTSNYVDSEKYFSWEHFFHKYLVDITRGTYQKYTKAKIESYYTIENNMKKIAAVILL